LIALVKIFSQRNDGLDGKVSNPFVGDGESYFRANFFEQESTEITVARTGGTRIGANLRECRLLGLALISDD
jgi:hypothetical protein